MSRLARVTAAQIIRVLDKRGFSLSRQSGSHKIYKHKSSGKRVTVPYHAGKILHPKVLKNILADAGMTTADLEESLK